MLHILHCSDLHFGPPYLPRVGEAVQRLAAELQLDSIVVSGDFTQRATRKQFIEAKEFLDRLPDVPKIVVPGNHDVPLYRIMERLKDPLRNYCEIIEDRLDYVVELEGATIVALNSTAPKSSISNGRIFPEQLEFCKQVFIDLPEETLKIVVAHHHFAPAPDYERDSTMPKAKRAIDIFVDLKVDMIMGGHLHRAYIGNTLDLYAGRNRDRGIIIVQSGTTTSYRGRGREKEKNSLNLLRVDSRMIQITHYIYFHEQDRFEPVSRHSFPRPGMRYYEQV
ncbi:metallophosphoesterase family protein [Rubinisphaera sp.]|mgnify:CR=1 FL=1|uniref:metallophosphoesterase family protein n=1 Tax=Rubinisphaera sp. TaxID=2024857 RepID=UPI000C118436|nr:metallophosphoesterase family protein [Rubinisphaera sp.]MBV10120.1 3',5'-cyclic-nucleotide phosphodiesterase [Rubinisphaera sp.]HCS54324.1 3',5'-cyclic-nucleotide phosphodiesterase [Planctomycetaceae bacterium]|tara:strand:+ start:6348 stop:7184 length:837 start_codon:yes stop_codon:yes gene_type:complete